MVKVVAKARLNQIKLMAANRVIDSSMLKATEAYPTSCERELFPIVLLISLKNELEGKLNDPGLVLTVDA